MLRVGMPLGTLRVPVTQSVTGCIPTQSMGTISGYSWSELTWRHTAPAHERMTETRGLAETQCFGDLIDRQLVLAEHAFGLLEPQFIEQLLIAAPQVLEMSAQGACRAVQLFSQPIQARRCAQLCREELADAAQPNLASGELGVLFAAAFGHGLMGDGVGQRQGLIEPAFIKGKGVGRSVCLLYTSPSPRDLSTSRMPSSA